MTTPAALQPELWTVSANKSLKVSLVDDQGAVSFNPTFTYPIFGDSEQIFGYQDLTINLAFDSTTFLPFLNVKYSKSLPADEIENIQEKLLTFLPETTIVKSESQWVDLFHKEQEDYKIPGEFIDSYTSEGNTFLIHKLNLKDADSLELHRRLQIFVLLFIEAGSYIDETDDLWEIYVVFQERSSSNEQSKIIGFCTAYSYWFYPGADSFDSGNEILSRKKISQFIVLPPYQSQKHGHKLYNILFEKWLNDRKIQEITIEDPSERFDDLRDRSDFERLYSKGVLKNLPGAPISDEWLTKTQKEEKLEKRQFHRLVEMALLYNFREHAKGNKKLIRLMIKKRLYEKNREALAELEDSVKFDKLQTAYEKLEEDYFRILSTVENSKKRPVDSEDNLNDSSHKKAK